MRDLDPDMGMIGVRRLIRQHSTNEEGWRLPEDMTVKDLIRHLIHRGALHMNVDTGAVDCPIPSFRRFMIGQGEPIPSPKPDPGSSPPPF